MDQGLCGFAIIQHGFARATEDIIWLIDTSPENFAKLEASMMGLPDGAVRDVNAEDCVSPKPALASTSVARQENQNVAEESKRAGIETEGHRKSSLLPAS